MVDRLEELLAQMADEDGEEQEDALELAAKRTASAVPAPEDGTGNRPEAPEGEEPPEEMPEGLPGAEPGAVSAPLAEERPGTAALPPGWGRPQEDVPVEAGPGRKGPAAPDAPGAGDGRTADAPGRTGTDAAAERGLEELYRRTAQAARPAPQSLPVEQAGRTFRAEEPGRAAELTVDELDRAVRRDSRRYDGGMTIF